MKTILTGDRPTGHLHLGHYIGSLKNRIALQDSYKTFIIIADIQALTDYFEEPQIVQKNIYSLVEDYLACGMDLEKSTVFVQSSISALAELTIYYMNLVSLARVQRNPTVKAELMQKKFKDNITCGFACYPVSQAADITAFQANVVPVGDDQLPMIEQTNEIVRRFNSIYGDTLTECKALLSSCSRLQGIDGMAKASKSLNNCIFLNDCAEVVKQKVMLMYTDPGHIKVSDPGKVEGNIVFHYLDAFCEEKEEVAQLKLDYQKGGLGDVVLKKKLISVLEEFFAPIREKRKKYSKNDLMDIIFEGNKKANKAANETLIKVKEAIGVLLK